MNVSIDHFPTPEERALYGYTGPWNFQAPVSTQGWSLQPTPCQLDLFLTLIERQCFFHSGDPVEAHAYSRTYIDASPHLLSAEHRGWLSVTFDSATQTSMFWFTGTPYEYTWWNMEWAGQMH
jgi:hypothetical protein|tara:strand:+ start:137 stop:502 length:366 start_codon:yes stop_codon:yes gene_type:complete